MSNLCGSCELTIDRRKSPGVSCSGFCGNSYHISCCGIPTEVLKYLKTTGFYWFCESCDKIKCNFENIIKTHVESKLQDVVVSVNKLFEDTRDEILKIATDKISQLSSVSNVKESVPLYSQVVDNKSMIIIKPKNSDQPNAQTKCDLMNSINPVDMNIQVAKVKNLSQGGILIGCNDSKDASKFKQMAKQKLSTNYEIKEPRKGYFKIKIVGMIEKYSNDDLVKFIRHQNELFSESNEVSVSKIWSTKSNKNLYQAILNVDAESYCKILNQGYIFVNYDVCMVYDAIELKICYKCSGFNHYEKTCASKKLVCPKCSGSHNVRDCPEDAVPKCINCVNARVTDCNHHVWDKVNCTVYKKKLLHYKDSLFGNK